MIRTERVSYDIDREHRADREPGRRAVRSTRVEARGLRAVLNDGTLRLESNVHGRFVP